MKGTYRSSCIGIVGRHTTAGMPPASFAPLPSAARFKGAASSRAPFVLMQGGQHSAGANGAKLGQCLPMLLPLFPACLKRRRIRRLRRWKFLGTKDRCDTADTCAFSKRRQHAKGQALLLCAHLVWAHSPAATGTRPRPHFSQPFLGVYAPSCAV